MEAVSFLARDRWFVPVPAPRTGSPQKCAVEEMPCERHELLLPSRWLQPR